jgi:outer membrane receptor protein involved in Fe transport
VSVGAQWTGDIGGGFEYLLRGDYAHVGTFHYDAGNRESERYGIANFRAGLGGESWRVEAWARNAFDEEYVPVAFQPDPADPDVYVGESGAPRTYGLTMTVSF